MSTNWSPGLRNQVSLGSIVLPVQPGSSLSMPRNLTIPQMFSGNNLFQFVHVEGLQFPVLDLQLFITAPWWLAAAMQLWFTRTDDDVQSAGALSFWNGVTKIATTASKVNLLVVGGSLGQILRCRLVIVGMGDITIAATGTPPLATKLTGAPATFQHVALGSGLSSTPLDAKAVASFDLTLSNNLDVCPEINDALFVAGVLTTLPEQNSGQLTGSLRLVKQAKAAPLAEELSGNSTIAITPPGGTVATITLMRPVCHDPREMSVQFPRQLKEYNYTLLGGATPGDPIMTIA